MTPYDPDACERSEGQHAHRAIVERAHGHVGEEWRAGHSTAVGEHHDLDAGTAKRAAKTPSSEVAGEARAKNYYSLPGQPVVALGWPLSTVPRIVTVTHFLCHTTRTDPRDDTCQHRHCWTRLLSARTAI